MNDFAGIKAMIVDDNAFIAKTLFYILDAFGIKKITSVKSLDQAEKNFHNRSYDVIFLDFMMQNREGLDFVKMARASNCESNSADTPIILVTGYTDIDTILMARDSGITEIIGKPFSPDQVYQKTHNALFNRREFINVDDYVGPNRRRRTMNMPEWTGENDRRAAAKGLENKGAADE